MVRLRGPRRWWLCAVVLLLGDAVAPPAATASNSPPVYGNETDRLSLAAFRDGIVADPTGALGSWNDSLHHCRWTGVACSRRLAGRVTALNLTSLRLVGRISPSIANLTLLAVVDLSGNQLSGVIPPQVGALAGLRLLDISNNALDGMIPADLSRCLELRVVNLDRNNLEGEIPAALGGLPNLLFLSMRSNYLTGAIPPSLGNLSSNAFQTLGLSGNRLTGGIPRELGRLAGLRTLLVGLNYLSGTIPPSIYNLSNVEVLEVVRNRLAGKLPPDLGLSFPVVIHLYLGNNQFEGSIPSSLPNASSLQTIDLSANMLTGTIPDNLGSLEQLHVFNVEKDMLEARNSRDWGFFTSLTNCSYIRRIDIAFNKLRGSLPNSIGNFSRELETLQIGGNQISGSIPVGIGNLRGLIKLAMGRNHFTGSIPSSLGKLENLAGLELAENLLTGEIPAEIGNITQLSLIYLGHNNLVGNVPSNLVRHRSLQELEISANNLSGSLPEELFRSPNLVYLDLSGNHLDGPLASAIGQSANLQYLDLSNNRMSGVIPAALGDCQSLVTIYLYSNFIDGDIPETLRNLKGIEALDLSANNLTGMVPVFLGSLKYLLYLNLSFNNLIGEVPTTGVFTNASAISLVGNRRICGGISALRLPPCPYRIEEKRHRPHLKIVVSVVCVGFFLILLCCSIVYIYFTRKNKGEMSQMTTESTPFSKFEHKKVSFHDLVKATDSFSGGNLIGIGSFGSVYRGILDDETIVAIKVLNNQRQGASKSFKQECEALRSIRHRNIVKIISVCSSIDYNGHDFKALVLEFIPNESLDKWLYPESGTDRRALDFCQRLCIVVDVASALDYLHNHCHSPIIHCDLKPSNVLLDYQMNAYVGDFGLARFLLTSDGNTVDYNSTTGIRGTIGYVPPEYGLGGAVCTYGDVFSFGILLFELFTAKRPTDDMFKDGLSIQKFVEDHLPEEVMSIVDPCLLSTGNETEMLEYTQNNQVSSRELVQEYVIPLMRIGLNCTMESPRERMTISSVVKEVHSLLEAYVESRR